MLNTRQTVVIAGVTCCMLYMSLYAQIQILYDIFSGVKTCVLHKTVTQAIFVLA